MANVRSGSGRGVVAIIALVIGLLIGAGAYAIAQPAQTTTQTSTSTVVSTTSLPQSTTTVISTIRSTVSTGVTTTVTGGNSSLPSIPSPIAVTLDPKTTAVLVLDYVFCYRMTGCNATLPAVQTLLTNARAAGALVIFTKVPVPKEIANKTGETIITNDIGPDKYYNTSLQTILQSHGIKTVVVTGVAPNGAMLYTAQESCVRHFTVVAAADTLFGTAYVQSYVSFQLLDAPGCSNPSNTPLAAAKATLSTTSLISFSG